MNSKSFLSPRSNIKPLSKSTKTALKQQQRLRWRRRLQRRVLVVADKAEERLARLGFLAHLAQAVAEQVVGAVAVAVARVVAQEAPVQLDAAAVVGEADAGLAAALELHRGDEVLALFVIEAKQLGEPAVEVVRGLAVPFSPVLRRQKA